MKESAPPSVLWAEQQQTRTVALNVGWRYVNVAVELLLGLGMLPFNAKSLGASDYGLWVLASSMVAYFPVLDLGFGGAMERFVAHYRALRNADAINENAVRSTTASTQNPTRLPRLICASCARR